MEEWEKDFEWLKVRNIVQKAMKKTSLPDLQAVLFLIGVQELGKWTKERFSKEEKQDLMHIAVCRLLSNEGFYTFTGRDQDGWPHYEMTRPFKQKGVKEQEGILIEKIIEYFHELEGENGGFVSE